MVVIIVKYTFNKVNKKTIRNTALRSGVVGSGIGGVAGAMNAERVEDVVPNAFGGSLGGAAIGGALPLATGIAGKMARPLFTAKKAPITIPTKEQLEAYPAESTFNPNHYTKEQAEQVFRERSQKINTEIFNDGLDGEKRGINHFLGTDRRPYVRTLENTVNNPDISYEQFVDGNKRQYFQKKYNDSSSDKSINDLVIMQDNKLFNKIPTNSNYIYNQLKKPTQNLSLSRRVSSTLEGINPVQDTYNILQNSVKVNHNTPNLKRIADFWNNYGRRYSPQYLTPYLAQYLANQQ